MNSINKPLPGRRSFLFRTSHPLSVGGDLAVCFLSALLIAIISLTALIYNVVDGAFGYIAYEYKKAPTEFTSTPVDRIDKGRTARHSQRESFQGRIQ